MKNTQKIYSLTKKREYTNVLNSSIRFLRDMHVDNVVYKSAAKELISQVRKLSDSEAQFLPVVPASMKKHVLRNVTVNVGTVLRGRFMRTIKGLWSDVYTLGKKHAVTDMMMNTGLFNNQFKRSASFHSLEGVTLLDLMPDEDIAEFASKDDLSPAQRKAITRAKRNLTILRNNVNRLKAEGALYDDFDLNKSTGKAARLTIEQRISFLEMIQEIDDLLRKAEASEKTFLSDEYLQRRYRVLTEDYASMYDDYIKEQIAGYLDKNIEGVRQIMNKQNDAEQLAGRIAGQLQGVIVERVKPNVKAEMILRTELGLAYNFGKLLGFTSPTDLNRKFRWNADWELEGKSDYEVCQACARMDGRIYTVQDLLTVGTRLDRGVLKYEGKTRTDFKNPALPMIPFHPCILAGTLITSYSESSQMCYNKNVEDIQIGDYVVVPTENKYERVTKVFKNWTEDYIYDIRTDSGQRLHITGNHPIWTGVDWKDAECVRVGDVITIAINTFKSTAQRNNSTISGLENNRPNMFGIRIQQQICNESSNFIQYKTNSKRDKRQICEHTGESSKEFGTNEEEQSELCPRNTSEDDCLTKEELRRPGILQTNGAAFTEKQLSQQSRSRSKKIGSYPQSQSKTKMAGTTAGKWTIGSSLQKSKWKSQIQSWVSRRFTALFQKWMGIKCGSNSKCTSNELGVRKAYRVIRWKNILSRFLPDRLGYLHRGQGLLDRGCKTEAQPITSRVSESENSFSRFLNVQGLDKEFQGLMQVRVTAVSRYKKPQYVYNLEVENANVYFANDVLVHNCCSCYFTLMPDDDPAEEVADRYVDTTKAPPAPPIPGTAADVNKLQDQTIPITVATGLLVGGLFLLSRSNVWRLFYRTAVEAVNDVAKATPTQQIIDVTKFITKETADEVATRYKDILDATIRTVPEELPAVVEPVVVPKTTNVVSNVSRASTTTVP